MANTPTYKGPNQPAASGTDSGWLGQVAEWFGRRTPPSYVATPGTSTPPSSSTSPSTTTPPSTTTTAPAAPPCGPIIVIMPVPVAQSVGFSPADYPPPPAGFPAPPDGFMSWIVPPT
ncbi:MAG TPA: hypothetical protein VGM88_12285 [Kofleriaceae bacterium]